MCSVPKMPKVTPQKVTPPTETVATPTYADAKQTKRATANKNQTAVNAGRDIKTTAQGDSSTANTKKKKLLGE